MIMTEEDQNVFSCAIDCHICGDALTPPYDYCSVCEAKLGVNKDYCLSCGEGFIDKVRDHCHITGKYRGAAHKACNLKLRISGAGTYIDKKSEKVKNKRATMVPVVFHNLRGYDSHLIMQALGTAAEGQKISCIPNNMEKYMTFGVGQLQFIDSLQFLNSSLDKLSSNLRPEDLKITGSYTNKLELLRRKGVYPYKYMDSFTRFDEEQLPMKEVFYSKLTREDITNEDYQHAQRVWKEMGCKTLGDYHDVYLKTDVLLLADVFETFRSLELKQYGLDPAHYFTLPGSSWDALLNHTGVELELLTNINQYLFVERGLRGGVTMLSERFAKGKQSIMCWV